MMGLGSDSETGGDKRYVTMLYNVVPTVSITFWSFGTDLLTADQ